MGMKMTTPMSKVNAYLQSEVKRIQMLTIRALSALGELCITDARDRPQEYSWFDHTGNLRSSIGYVIAYKGNIVQYSEFKQIKDGSEGSDTGKKFAEEIAKRISKDYALVVVAGMNYAEFVEAMDNKDVLAHPELFAKAQLPKMIKMLKRQIG